MKVLLINGSSNKKGCTFTALTEVATTLEKEGVETEIISIGAKAINDCTGCFACINKQLGRCIIGKDMANEIIEKAKDADGFIFGTPVYFAHPTGRILSLMDRVFLAGRENFAYKPASAVIVSRRAGTTASFDVMNKYFAISNMPIVTSQYWNNVHGLIPEDVMQDKEGLQVMRVLGKNMAWLLKCIELSKENGINLPELGEERAFTNFISNSNNFRTPEEE